MTLGELEVIIFVDKKLVVRCRALFWPNLTLLPYIGKASISSDTLLIFFTKRTLCVLKFALPTPLNRGSELQYGVTINITCDRGYGSVVTLKRALEEAIFYSLHPLIILLERQSADCAAF